MCIQKAHWFSEYYQWRMRGIIRGQGGGNTELLFIMTIRAGQGGGRRTLAVAEAEAKREVGTNGE